MSAADVVPWIDTTVPASDPAAATTTTTFVSEPPCTASQLHGAWGDQGYAAGNHYYTLQFTNLAHAGCALRGTPTLHGTNQVGRPVTIPTTPAQTPDNFGPAADVPSGAIVSLQLATATDPQLCPQTSFDYHNLVVALPQRGGSVPVPAGQLVGSCGVIISTFGYPAQPPAPPVPGTLGTLTVAYEALPTSTSANTTLRYEITLSNPTTIAVLLAPCPGYTEYLSSRSGPYIQRYYLLNCATVHLIPANGALTFAMDFAVPASLPAGQTKIGWQLLIPDGPATASQIDIRTP